MILGVVEHDRGKLNDLSLQMLTLGYRLAEQLDVPLHAILIGDAAQPLADGLAAFGVSTVHLARHERLDDYAPEAWARCVVELMNTRKPRVLLAAGTDRGHEVLAHVAARTDLPLAANCVEVRPGEPFEVTRVRWGGSLLEDARLGGAVKLLTVAPHAIAAEALAPAGEVAVETFAPSLSDQDLWVRI